MAVGQELVDCMSKCIYIPEKLPHGTIGLQNWDPEFMQPAGRGEYTKENKDSHLNQNPPDAHWIKNMTVVLVSCTQRSPKFRLGKKGHRVKNWPSDNCSVAVRAALAHVQKTDALCLLKLRVDRRVESGPQARNTSPLLMFPYDPDHSRKAWLCSLARSWVSFFGFSVSF